MQKRLTEIAHKSARITEISAQIYRGYTLLARVPSHQFYNFLAAKVICYNKVHIVIKSEQFAFEAKFIFAIQFY